MARPKVGVETVIESEAIIASGGWGAVFRATIRQPKAMVGAAVVLIFVVLAVFAEVISPFPPMQQHRPLTPPGAPHYLGTDHIGRDVLSFIIYGSRVSLVFAIGAAAISFVVGVVVGAIPSFFGGKFDEFASRFVELVLMIPMLFLLIIVVAIFGQSVAFVVTVVGLTIWPSNAKLMRSQVLSLKTRGYVMAATAAGVAPLASLLRHVIPNALPAIVANTTLQMSEAVLLESGLSFLGLGDPNHPSWGQMLSQAPSYLTMAPWMMFAPGVALIILLLGLHLMGDALVDSLHPPEAEA